MSEPKNICVRNLRLPTADAIAKIQDFAGLPDDDKAWIISKINKTGFAGVCVDAHESFHEGATHIHLSITKLF